MCVCVGGGGGGGGCRYGSTLILTCELSAGDIVTVSNCTSVCVCGGGGWGGV